MSNSVYPAAKKRMLDLFLALGTPKAVLVDLGAYTYSATHQFLSDIPSGARVATATLTNVTTAAGVLDADDPVFAGLSSPPSIEAIVIYVDTGNPSTSPLLPFIDTATGLPVGAGATEVDVAWSNGSSKILAL